MPGRVCVSWEPSIQKGCKGMKVASTGFSDSFTKAGGSRSENPAGKKAQQKPRDRPSHFKPPGPKQEKTLQYFMYQKWAATLPAASKIS